MKDGSSKRRQPRQERSKATVAAILEATGKLLAADGIAHLSTNRIAVKAGVGVGSLYEYFDNKDALVRALVEQFATKIDTEINDVFDERGDSGLDTMLPRLIHVTVTIYDQDSALYARLLRHIPFIPGENPLDIIEEPIRRRFADMLRACADETNVSDPDRSALVCVHAVRRMVDAVCADPKIGIKLSDLEGELVSMTKRYLTSGS